MIFDPSLWAAYLPSALCSAWHITDTHIFVVLMDGRIMPCECLYRHSPLVSSLTRLFLDT